MDTLEETIKNEPPDVAEKCRKAYEQGKAEGYEFELALANVLLDSDIGHCFICENSMKNITFDRVSNGCDGECCHTKTYTVEEFLIFLKEKFKLEKDSKEEEV